MLKTEEQARATECPVARDLHEPDAAKRLCTGSECENWRWASREAPHSDDAHTTAHLRGHCAFDGFMN